MENSKIQVHSINTTLFDVPEPRKQGRVSAWIEKTAGRPLRMRDKIISAILLIAFLFVFYLVLDANKYRSLVHVVDGTDRVGVNPTATALDFGDLSRGMSAVRKVDLKNGTAIPMYVMIMKTGTVGDLMQINHNYFTLAPHSESQVEFTVYMPASAQVDAQYNGRVYLFKVPTFGI